ncbi:hypothetical protein NR798_10820 [Archangium gephyra]|uniref:hypothetical protein n=1 Tax=Archangium gephyra TaxID=48 RepID=UPI0035D3FE92
MNAVLCLLRDLDRRLLLHHPEFWMLRFHHVHLWACLLILVTVPVALLTPSLSDIPDPSVFLWQVLAISVAASLYWLYLQSRNLKSLPFRSRTRWYPKVLGFWYCLMVINSPAFLSSWLMHERITQLVDPETLAIDTALFEKLDNCVILMSVSVESSDSYCSGIRSAHGAVLVKYGAVEHKNVMDLLSAINNRGVSLVIGQGVADPELLRRIRERLWTLKDYHEARKVSHPVPDPAVGALGSASLIRKGFWILTLTTLFASVILFVGSAQWGSIIWFLAPIFCYMVLAMSISWLAAAGASIGGGLLVLVILASWVHVFRAKRKSLWLAAAWGIINFTYPMILFVSLPGIVALLLYCTTLPALQIRQDHLRALPV